MKIKIYYVFFVVMFLFNFLSCNDNSVEVSNYTAANYISHQNSGCLSGSGVLSIENETTIELKRRGIYFTIILNFTTLCEASFKDSVSISSNEISICLANETAAMCTCPYRDEFNFKSIKGGEYKIGFYLLGYPGDSYHLVADTTIII
ncbi:MAG: hypothetical protein ACM34J_15025 [Ignavibacteria bacterium]